MSDSDVLLNALRRHANEERALKAQRRDNLHCALFILFMAAIAVSIIIISLSFM
jgi:hypothetical protein